VLSLRIAPRWSLFAPMARLNGWRTLRTFAREVTRLDTVAKTGGPIEVASSVTPADVSASGAQRRRCGTRSRKSVVRSPRS